MLRGSEISDLNAAEEILRECWNRLSQYAGIKPISKEDSPTIPTMHIEVQKRGQKEAKSPAKSSNSPKKKGKMTLSSKAMNN